MTLRWEKQRAGVWHAYSGQIVVGMIGKRDDGSCWFDVTGAVNLRGVAKPRNLRMKSIRSARRAVNTAWSRWLEVTCLQPIQEAASA